MQRTGGEIIAECLIEQGVDTVFGYPGGAILNIYDALYKYQDQINHYLTAHEQGAAHAADGYARATGKVGVCLATSGPGATNLVTGIATAYMDSVPMVAITANVPLALLGRDSFQEVDIVGITMPITKHNYIVKDINELASTLRKAFYIAQEGRPGPVLVDVPKDITAQVAEYIYEAPRPIETVSAPIPEEDLLSAIQMIKTAKRPLIYMGGGVVRSGAAEAFKDFVDKVQAPVASTMMGLGGFPSTHELFTGLLGMHGTKASNMAATECDLIIAVGARFSDRAIGKVEGFAPGAKILQIDIDPAEVNKNIRTHYSIIGTITEVLKDLNPRLEKQERKEWTEKIKAWQRDYPLTYEKNTTLKPQFVIEKVKELAAEDAVITTEVGQNQIWTALFYKFTQPRSFITSGGLGTMGFGLGACIGAQIGLPERQLFNIAGDGCFYMNCNELATAVHYNLPIRVIVLNNHVLGMVRQWQGMFYGKRFSNTTLDRKTDIVKLAEAYGATGFNITKNEEVEDVLKKAMAIKGPVVINCEIDRDELVLPMVPPGADIKDLIME
ncbi:acetolactate synthase, large subunit, biosynthetic type [Alkaliphilus metalliredigens QYMF]|uniref:Acetolactate synthase n=1 Tax=Alkaliphilus metalliredigens (strain QYMF) TaxID=293826 RepID=A6TTL0_ALKMQ|nr:biosynthetic-type acetolactate synthase large subunit [Alkaliphilus metalliredigens]ABR49528.1 acetolactate synthase, large subunit, biosynthetic type [Alkaliphilus metalliredigens QYMF]